MKRKRPMPKKRRGAGSLVDPKMKRAMKKLITVVVNYTDSSDGRLLSEPFMKLPSRRELPDYYEIIKKPLTINKLLQKIEEGKVSIYLLPFILFCFFWIYAYNFQ